MPLLLLPGSFLLYVPWLLGPCSDPGAVQWERPFSSGSQHRDHSTAAEACSTGSGAALPWVISGDYRHIWSLPGSQRRDHSTAAEACSTGCHSWVGLHCRGVYHHNNLSLSYHNTPPNKAKPKINTQVSVLSGNFCSSKSYCAKWSTMIFKVFYGWIILHFNFNLSSCISVV